MKWIEHNSPAIGKDDLRAVMRPLRSNWVAHGRETAAFEAEFCRFLGTGLHAAATSSGTSALFLALHALGVGRGDEVVVPTYVCSALLNAVYWSGAEPVLSDVDPESSHVTPHTVETKITPRTKAIVIPHLYGLPVDLRPFRALRIPIVEDCAQSIGASTSGRMTGTGGDIAIFSFYATKLLTTGHGGMVVSRNRSLLKRVRDFMDFDCRRDYKPRFNFYMSDIQAALGRSQLQKYPSMMDRRHSIAERYSGILQKKRMPFLEKDNGETVFYRFVLRTGAPLRVRRRFTAAGIRTIVPIRPGELLHRYLKQDRAKFPGAEEIASSTLSIPVYPALTDHEVSRICRVLKEA